MPALGWASVVPNSARYAGRKARGRRQDERRAGRPRRGLKVVTQQNTDTIPGHTNALWIYCYDARTRKCSRPARRVFGCIMYSRSAVGFYARRNLCPVQLYGKIFQTHIEHRALARRTFYESATILYAFPYIYIICSFGFRTWAAERERGEASSSSANNCVRYANIMRTCKGPFSGDQMSSQCGMSFDHHRNFINSVRQTNRLNWIHSDGSAGRLAGYFNRILAPWFVRRTGWAYGWFEELNWKVAFCLEDSILSLLHLNLFREYSFTIVYRNYRWRPLSFMIWLDNFQNVDDYWWYQPKTLNLLSEIIFELRLTPSWKISIASVSIIATTEKSMRITVVKLL